MKTAITIFILSVIGLVFALAIYKSDPPAPHQHTQTPTTEAQQTPAQPTNGYLDEPEAPSASLADQAPVEPAVPVVAIEGLHAVAAETAQVSTVGSLTPDSGYMFEAQLTGWGAAVRYIRLSQYTQTAIDDKPLIIQQPLETSTPDGGTTRIYPFAARAITVNGQRINLENQRWELGEPGQYSLTLADSQEQPVLRISRRYWASRDVATYDLRCDQQIVNLSDAPLRVVWEQYAQGDVPNDDAAYLGDRRVLVAGYHNLEYNPSRQFIYTDKTYLNRQSIIDGDPFWHDNEDLPADRELIWVAGLNRYFAAVVHRAVKPANNDQSQAGPIAPALDKLFPKLGQVVIGPIGPGQSNEDRKLAFTLTSAPIDLAPQSQTPLNLSLYAGPRKSEIFERQPYLSLGFAKLIVYELGCTLCTFQPLAQGLLTFLKWIHYVARDWGVSIIFLVLCVRLVLHPITKKAQVNMFKMSKQMQSIQPEIEKLKKKYKDDQKLFQQEQLKLWREKGINPVNMLGCLPMFLQTPIWIALYAMLYFAIELRHEPAFYGVFQALSNGGWQFLGDLSSPDNFIRFSGPGYKLNLIFVHPTFAGINIIPLLMAVVFYFQQKLTTPPPANEQAAQQQKMMKFMVLLFPVMLYSAPSGLTLYILASTFAGIVDSYFVRKHVKEQEEAGKLFDKKSPPKPGGFMDRMGKALAAKQAELAKQQQRQGGRTPKRRKGK